MTITDELIALISNLDDKQVEVLSNVALSMSSAKAAAWSGKIRFELFIRSGLAQNIQIGSDRSVQLGNGPGPVFFA